MSKTYRFTIFRLSSTFPKFKQMNKSIKLSVIFLAVSELFLASAFAQNNESQELIIESTKITDSEKSIQIQKDAPNFVNVINAEEIRQIPSFNPADVVRTLPGVSESHDTGEARYVYIRGLDADYNTTTLDGVRLLPAAQGSPANGTGGRAVAFDSLPTGLIDSITVTKTLRPDQDAEAIGGTIEITTKEMPLNGKNTFFDAQIGTGYEPLRGTPIYDLSLKAGFRFGGSDLLDAQNKKDGLLNGYSDKPFSLMLFGTFSQDQRGIDDIEPSNNPAGSVTPYSAKWDQRYYEYQRQRHGYGFNLTFQPNADDSYYMKAFDTGYVEKKSDNITQVRSNGDTTACDGVVCAAGSGNYYETGLNLRKTLVDHQEHIDNQVLTIGGKNKFDDKVLDYYAAYSQGKFVVDYDYSSRFNYTGPAGANLIYAQNGQQNTPTYNLASLGINPADYANPANYSLKTSTFFTELSTDQQYSTGINLKSKVSFGNFEDESLKVGANARIRTRDIQFGEYAATVPTGITAAPFVTGSSKSFYFNQYNTGPLLRTGSIQNVLTYTTDGPSSPYYAPLEYQHDTERVYATYGQYEFKQGRWSILGGARVEATQTTVYANQFDINSNLVGNQQSNSYFNVLPSIQGKFELEKNTFVRFAYSSGLARPTFNQLNPAATISSGGGLNGADLINSGNANLKPTTANSFDLSLEKYLNKGGIISFGVFDKQLSNVIVPRSSFANSYNQGGVVDPNPVQAMTYSNIGSVSTVSGFEFNYIQKYADLLPGAWGGFGTAVNFTYVNSSWEQTPGVFTALPGTSKNIANASIFYDKSGFFAKLGLNYASASLWAAGGASGDGALASDPSQNQYYDSRTFLDMTLAYRIDKHYQVYVSGANLTNQSNTYYVGYPAAIEQKEFYGPTFRAGVNIRFD